MLTSLKIKLLLIIYLLLSSCAGAVIDIKDKSLEASYYKYLKELEIRGIEHDNPHILVRVKQIDRGTAVGLCWLGDSPVGNRMCVISIHEDYDEYNRELIFFHELTHCLFDLREHYEYYDESEFSRSLFNAYYGYGDSSEFHEYMKRKLFDHDIPLMLKNK
jgi:hypothetical protein